MRWTPRRATALAARCWQYLQDRACEGADILPGPLVLSLNLQVLCSCRGARLPGVAVRSPDNHPPNLVRQSSSGPASLFT